MNVDEPDQGTARAAVTLAGRAPSIHNSQPWRWWVGDRVVQLHADLVRWLPLTDADARDLLLSCGAALHHLRVALAALDVAHEVERLPDPEQPDLLARVRLRAGPAEPIPGIAADEVKAIRNRRSDRRVFTDWPVPTAYLDELTDSAAAHGALLRTISDPAARRTLQLAAHTAAVEHAGTPGYDTELAVWSGLHASDDGVPAANAPVTGARRHGLPARRFAHGELPDPAAVPVDGATLIVLGTSSDDQLSQLRAGEALSAVLLHATALGLASCPLSEPLEVEGTRMLVRDQVLDGGLSPQLVLRLGWPRAGSEPLPPTPRRPLADQVELHKPDWW